MNKLFRLHTPFPPAGDQEQAIAALTQARPGISTLVGVTGSGKTYTMAQVIAQQNQPVIILAPNKTLAAQLYEEFSRFFPENKVCYFVSYYDYYQPESYVPAHDRYVPKEAKINSEIERLRVEATAALMTRRDTIIIASVSAIYSLGDPTDYRTSAYPLYVGMPITQETLLRELTRIQYSVSTFERGPGKLYCNADSIEIDLPYMAERVKIGLHNGTVGSIAYIRKSDDTVIRSEDTILIFPARHFVMGNEKRTRAIASIQDELERWLPKLTNQLYRERLRARVERDIELLEKNGTCPGIENYSIHFDGRPWGNPPFCLFDFFTDPLIILDESHMMIPQLQGMYAGDRVRKKNLVDYGFRLPSAYENRPLRFDEIEQHLKNVIFVSATPGDYELTKADTVVEQIVRPTGLVDPEVTIRPRVDQLEHLLSEIRTTRAKGFRTLVTVLTKKMAEDLALYLEGKDIAVCYLHSDLKTPQRTEILHKLRAGTFDCVVGVNLLREGLDLPEVALVAIMDADIEGFLRDKRSLIQTIGRAARNVAAKVILFADTITESMRLAIDETDRRRTVQQAHNKKHKITPRTVIRAVTKSISPLQKAIARASSTSSNPQKRAIKALSADALAQRITEIEQTMHTAAQQHDYDSAIQLRDELYMLKQRYQELVTKDTKKSAT